MDSETRERLDRIEADSRRRDDESKTRDDEIKGELRGIRETLQTLVRMEERQQADRDTLVKHDERLGDHESRLRGLETSNTKISTAAKTRWARHDKVSLAIVGGGFSLIGALLTTIGRYLVTVFAGK